MISYGKNTRLKPEEVIEKSVRFFGPAGVGLEVRDRGDACAHFEGGGGFVSVSACAEEKGTRVSLEAREWEVAAKEFIAKV